MIVMMIMVVTSLFFCNVHLIRIQTHSTTTAQQAKDESKDDDSDNSDNSDDDIDEYEREMNLAYESYKKRRNITTRADVKEKKKSKNKVEDEEEEELEGGDDFDDNEDEREEGVGAALEVDLGDKKHKRKDEVLNRKAAKDMYEL